MLCWLFYYSFFLLCSLDFLSVIIISMWNSSKKKPRLDRVNAGIALLGMFFIIAYLPCPKLKIVKLSSVGLRDRVPQKGSIKYTECPSWNHYFFSSSFDVWQCLSEELASSFLPLVLTSDLHQNKRRVQSKELEIFISQVASGHELYALVGSYLLKKLL